MCNTKDQLSSLYSLKRPCGNCPFLKVGAIELNRGRLESIIDGMLADDFQTFVCHKTINDFAAEDAGLDEYDDESVQARGVYEGERMCAGAASYLMKARRPSVGMRIAFITGSIQEDHWDSAKGLVIDPAEV